ncbi:MAG: flagellar hook-associated protein FlgK [Smithella sp.]
MSLGSVLNTAKQAILSNLTAINVTGSNIANVSTPGYTRLNPVFNAVGTSSAGSGQEQVGVEISDIQRIYNKFLDAQIVTQNAAVSSASARNDLLTQIESVLNESTGSGVSDALSQFWSAWDNLSANPSGEAERSVIVSAAQNLTFVFNQKAEELYTLQRNTDETIAGDIEKLNGYLSDMSALNTEIVRIESAGGSASALRDTRGTLLDNISSIIDINYIEQSDGALYIYLPQNGKTLVDGSQNWQLMVQPNSSNSNFNDIVFTDDTNNPLNDYIQGGELGGLLEIRDVTLPAYIDKLNQTASSIVNKVNSQHMAGYDQDGNIGDLFFEKTTEAKDMAVSAAIVADMRKIAASSTLNADGDNATAMTALKDDKMYASMGIISFTGGSSATGQINNIGQTYKNTTSPIVITRGATAGSWSIAAASDKGGYNDAVVLSSSDSNVTVDLDNNGAADITLNLSGSWNNGDTLTFSLSKQDSTTTIGGYYSAFIAKVGQDVSNSTTALEREKAIATQNSTQREELSGVSLDEEMLNLIKYQMAYNAASRVTGIVSELMDTVINLGE